jgi:hypothetical protein
MHTADDKYFVIPQAYGLVYVNYALVAGKERVVSLCMGKSGHNAGQNFNVELLISLLFSGPVLFRGGRGARLVLVIYVLYGDLSLSVVSYGENW